MRCQICNSETENFERNKLTGVFESICDKCKKKLFQDRRRYFDITQEDLKQFIDLPKQNDNNDYNEGA